MRQQRNNIPASSDKEYFKRAIFLPFLDAMIQQLNIRFGEQAIYVVRALSLIPRHIDQTQDDTINEIFNYYKDDLPSPDISVEIYIEAAMHLVGPHPLCFS
jgi:hypothetical protein